MLSSIPPSSSPPDGYSLVVPVYKSSQILHKFVARIKPVAAELTLPLELIFVNDASPDNSWTIIKELSSQQPWIRGIDMARNFGQHNALLAGIRAARYNTIVTMDDDLQHPPEELPKLVEAFKPGVDVIYATPLQLQHGLLRDLSSVITKIMLQRAMGSKTARMVSAWRIFRTELRNGFASYNSPFVNIDVLLTWSTTRFSAMPIRHDPRDSGSSNYSILKLVRHALNMLTGFSILPLQFASVVGFIFTLFGILVLTYVVGRYLLLGSSVAGFPFLASIIAIFSGAQLFALGIIGEYIALIHFRTMNKPAYSIADTTDNADDANR